MKINTIIATSCLLGSIALTSGYAADKLYIDSNSSTKFTKKYHTILPDACDIDRKNFKVSFYGIVEVREYEAEVEVFTHTPLLLRVLKPINGEGGIAEYIKRIQQTRNEALKNYIDIGFQKTKCIFNLKESLKNMFLYREINPLTELKKYFDDYSATVNSIDEILIVSPTGYGEYKKHAEQQKILLEEQLQQAKKEFTNQAIDTLRELKQQNLIQYE